MQKKRNKIEQKTVSLREFVLHNIISTIVDKEFGFSGRYAPFFFDKIP